MHICNLDKSSICNMVYFNGLLLDKGFENSVNDGINEQILTAVICL